MSSEVPSSSSHWVQPGSAYNAPTQKNPISANMFANNVSVQTGEEFSMGFVQNLSGSKLAPQIDLSRDREQLIALPQNNQLAYEDLARILGLQRMNSECMSETSEFASARGSVTEINNGSYNDPLNKFQKHTSDDAQGSMKLTNETMSNRSDSRPTAPTIYPESSHQNQPPGSVAGDGSQSEKIKFLCSFGGKILPRPGDGKLRYVGGDTRIISIYKNLSWADLVKKTSLICNQPHSIKYQLPGEDLDSLISVSSDEDLQNMIEEYYGLEKTEGSQRPRLFLIPLNECEKTSSFESSTIPQSSPDYQYVVAVNGVLDPSPRHNLNVQYFRNELNQCGVDLDQRPTTCMDSPSVLHPIDVRNNGMNISNPTQYSNESQSVLKSPKPIQYSPNVVEQGDASSINVHLNGNISCRDSNGSNSSFIAAHPPRDYSIPDASGYSYGTQRPISVNDIPSNKHVEINLDQQHRAYYQNRQPTHDVLPHPVLSSNEDFDKFLRGRPVLNQKSFQSEKSSQSPDGVTGLLAGSTESNDYHNGMPHAYSDSKLQEHGGTSAHCSLEGMGPSSLNLAKTPLSQLLVSGAPENNLKIQDQILNVQSGSHNWSNLLNHSHYGEVPMVGRKEDNFPTEDGWDRKLQENFQDVNVNDYVTIPVAYNPILNPFLGQSNKVQETSYPAPVSQLNVTANVSSTSDSLQSLGALQNIVTTGIYRDKGSRPQQGQQERVTSYQSTEFQKYNLNGMTHGAQRTDSSWGKFVESATIIPTTDAQSHHETALYDLFPGLSIGMPNEPANLPPLKDAVLQHHLQVSSAELDPFGFCGQTTPSLLPYHISPVNMSGNQTEQAVHKRETSLIDCDFNVSFGQNVENVRHEISYPEISTYDKSSAVGKDATSAQTTHLELSSEAEIVDGVRSDVCSPNVTDGDHVCPDNELEDGNCSEGKDVSISDAVIAEMEAGIYGLQIIKNADLEELRELGSGTYGTVYHGKWRGTDVAIKRIKKSCFAGRSSEEERLTKDFWREAQILSNLHHPNVVAFYGVVPDGSGGTLATVTEFMVNGSLRNVLLKKDRSLDRRKKLIIAMDAAFGMEYLHSKNIVHFDLKCDNLLVNLRDPQRPVCKVGDFGLSRIKRNTLVSGGVRGTLPWMAPELLNGSSSKVSEKVDVFSFGIALWEILTGEEPYSDMHCGAIIGGIVKNTLRPPIPQRCDSEWKKLMEQCWSPDPEERPSFTEITNRLRAMSVALQPKGLHNR
uniref:Protein kinase domain-containing protein n=1 Tax=Kalanchoe fedtschenkoi TaxID=63787 RepID=A0A7N1A2F3_KALFE